MGFRLAESHRLQTCHLTSLIQFLLSSSSTSWYIVTKSLFGRHPSCWSFSDESLKPVSAAYIRRFSPFISQTTLISPSAKFLITNSAIARIVKCRKQHLPYPVYDNSCPSTAPAYGVRYLSFPEPRAQTAYKPADPPVLLLFRRFVQDVLFLPEHHIQHDKYGSSVLPFSLPLDSSFGGNEGQCIQAHPRWISCQYFQLFHIPP